MKDSQRQLEELTKKMAKLAQEKAELESRNRILEHVVRLNVDHVEEMSSNQACPHQKTRLALLTCMSTLSALVDFTSY